ncbi:AAA family ATPase [Methylomagnum ishizawai]|uniref:AAA family ATPase n=1 Tax=Methylomagnum ishizawai TaxID=1760988 RepID=UPI001C8196D3|nr:AAA family ATPase [Methylomagnum ishizawai]
MTGDLYQALLKACAHVGILYREVAADGRWHDTDIEDDPRGRGDGRIKLFPDGRGGMVHNWKSSDKPHVFFINDGRTLTDEERRERQALIQRAKEEEKRDREQAALKAVALWKAATELEPDYPYCTSKGVKPVMTLREIPSEQATGILGYLPKSKKGPLAPGRWIVVPIKIGDRITSVELIDQAGRKAALRDGAKGGGYWAAQPLPKGDGAGLILVIAEGVATALSAKEATGYAAVAALSCYGLLKVAKAMQARYPAARLLILADIGHGQDKAVEATKTTGAVLVLPSFPEGSDGTDFNDLAAVAGLAEVRKQIEASMMADNQADSRQPPQQGAIPDRVQLIHGASIRPVAIKWLWPGWLAAGKFHVLPGPPGTGKTTLAAAIAATLTRGGLWPDGTRAEIGNVLIWSGEDDPEDTLVPRLLACGADINRVYFVGDTLVAGEPRPFDPATDFAKLAATVADIEGGVKLLIVDPIVSAVAGDSHKNAEVRRSLQPLVTLGADMGAAVLGITHFSKSTAGRDPVERVTGSIAFGALARVVFAAAKLPDDDQEGGARLFCRSKSNIGPDSGGFRYDLEQIEVPGHPDIFATRVLWGAAMDGSARELLARADAVQLPEEPEKPEKAPDANMEWLRNLLGNGGMVASDVEVEAKEAGISSKQLRTAREKLGVQPVKREFSGGWFWQLPKVPEPAHDSRTQKTGASSAPSAPSGVSDSPSTREPAQEAQGAHDFEGMPQGQDGAASANSADVEFF